MPKTNKSGVILFATFWNEIDWIRPSLEQIDKIEPIEAIICDGCFDPTRKLPSTDGTREIISDFVSTRPNMTMISPVLIKNKAKAFQELVKGHSKLPSFHYLYPSRYLSALRGVRKSTYRINQALTFSKMISLSQRWKPDRWFMNYDCDQFYEDSMFPVFHSLNEKTPESQIVAGERTFFKDLDHFTEDYEKRDFNNLPHKIHSNTIIVPTRDIYLEGFYTRKKYSAKYKKKNIGKYFHYKIRNKSRFEAGYMVGDRKKPNTEAYSISKLSPKDHPAIIKKYYQQLRNRFCE